MHSKHRSSITVQLNDRKAVQPFFCTVVFSLFFFPAYYIMSEYEKRRAANIARNKAAIASLGLDDAAAALSLPRKKIAAKRKRYQYM